MNLLSLICGGRLNCYLHRKLMAKENMEMKIHGANSADVQRIEMPELISCWDSLQMAIDTKL